MQQTDFVEAVHYHRWIDHEREGGLRLGLWTVEPGTIWRPKDKRPSWSLYQAIETPQERKAFDRYRQWLPADEQ